MAKSNVNRAALAAEIVAKTPTELLMMIDMAIKDRGNDNQAIIDVLKTTYRYVCDQRLQRVLQQGGEND